jgi:hypothetical protein
MSPSVTRDEVLEVLERADGARAQVLEHLGTVAHLAHVPVARGLWAITELVAACRRRVDRAAVRHALDELVAGGELTAEPTRYGVLWTRRAPRPAKRAGGPRA